MTPTIKRVIEKRDAQAAAAGDRQGVAQRGRPGRLDRLAKGPSPFCSLCGLSELRAKPNLLPDSFRVAAPPFRL